jgi:hypothetical protein
VYAAVKIKTSEDVGADRGFQAPHYALATINLPRAGNVSSIMRAVGARNTTF